MAISILSNTAIASTGRLLNTFLGIIVIGLLTRLLGEASFGYYTLVITYASLLQLAADAGLYLTLTRLLAQEPAARHELVAHATALRLGLLVTLGVVGFLATMVFPPLQALGDVFTIIWLGLMAQSLSQLCLGIYQTDQVVWRATVGDLAGRVVQIGSLWVLGGDVTLAAAALIFTVSTGLTLLLHLVLLPQWLTWPTAWHTTQWRRLWQLSWPLGAMLLLNAIYFRIDMLILSYYRSPAEVGHYGLAYRIVESSLFFPAMFGGLLLPRLSERAARSRHAVQALLEQSLRLVICGAIFVVGILLIIPEAIVVLVGGEQFLPAGALLRILGGALAIMFLGNLFGFTLVALGRSRVLLYLYAGLALGNTIANLGLIPSYGAVAAAWVTVATEAVAMSVAGLVVWRHLYFRLPLSAITTMLVCLLMTLGLLALVPTSTSVILQVGAAAVLYLALNIVSGTLTRRHLALLL